MVPLGSHQILGLGFPVLEGPYQSATRVAGPDFLVFVGSRQGPTRVPCPSFPVFVGFRQGPTRVPDSDFSVYHYPNLMKEKIQKQHSLIVLQNSSSEQLVNFTGYISCESFQIFRKASVINIYNKSIFLINTTEVNNILRSYLNYLNYLKLFVN